MNGIKTKKKEVLPNHAEEWTINMLKAHKLQVSEGTLKKPMDMQCGGFPFMGFY
jgi:hypothetical protein